MADWLEEARERLESGIDGVGELALSPADAGVLLELAHRAAHDSGARTNAPLVCYPVGRSGAVTPAQAIEILERETPS